MELNDSERAGIGHSTPAPVHTCLTHLSASTESAGLHVFPIMQIWNCMLQIICICICILCYYIAIPELLSKVFRGSMALAPHAKIFYMKVIHNRPHLASGCTTVARKDARAQIQQQKLRLEFPQGYRKGHGRTRIADIVLRGLSFLEPRHTLNKAKHIQLITMAQPGYRFSGDLTLLEVCAKFLHIYQTDLY